MRVRWHDLIVKRVNDDGLPIFEKGDRHEGEVVSTVYAPDKGYITKGIAIFIILLDDNTFAEMPVGECEKVDDIYI